MLWLAVLDGKYSIVGFNCDIDGPGCAADLTPCALAR